MSKKLAFYTYPFPRVTSYFDMIDLSVAYGHEAVEGFSALEFETPDVEAAKKIRAYADEKGVKFCCFSIYTDISVGDLDENIARLKGYVDVTAALGCPYIHHTIIGECLDPARVLPRKEELFAVGVRVVQEVFDYAKEKGVRAIYEPQGYIFNGTEGIGRLIEASGRDIGIVCDFGNVCQVGEDILPFIKAYRDRIVHVHVKDMALFETDPEGKHLKTAAGTFMDEAKVGEGCVPMAEAFALLKEMGYDGYYGVEYGAKSDDSPEMDRCLQYIDRFLED